MLLSSLNASILRDQLEPKHESESVAMGIAYSTSTSADLLHQCLTSAVSNSHHLIAFSGDPFYQLADV